MPTPIPEGCSKAHTQAAELIERLQRWGFPAVQVVATKFSGHYSHPCIQVSAPRWGFAKGTEYVYLAPDYEGDGQWYFWWTPREPLTWERIGPAEMPPIAAGIIRAAHIWRAVAA